MENTTVDDAIKRGMWLLGWGPLIVFLLIIGLFGWVFFSFTAGDVIWINVTVTIVSLFLPVILLLLYTFIMFPRWQIWAFENVRNVHELKHRAILRQLHPKDSSFLWRLMIVSADQKRKIEELEQKFALPDVFVDDYDLPFEKSYSYAKSENLVYLLVTMCSIIGGLVFLLQREAFLGIFLLLGAGTLGMMTYKRMSASEPVLTISNEGITTKESGFHAWSDIDNEQISWMVAEQTPYFGLSFEVNGELIKISLRELTGNSSYKVDHVIRTYRGRYEATKL